MKSSLTCLLLAIVPVCAACAATPPPVVASLTMRTPASLELSYTIPASCAALSFLNDGIRPDLAATLRKDWRAADDCTEFDGKDIRRKHPSCRTLRLSVPASTRSVDRVYLWAYPVEGGLYAHTVAYAVTDACGPVDWHVAAPGGTVVVDGKVTANAGSRSAAQGGGEHMPTVLLRQRFAPGALPRIHAAKDFGPATRSLLEQTVASIEGELGKMLPGLPFSVPFIVASPSAPHNYWGDVANRTVMRLAFPTAPGPEQEQVLHSFVTHEMAHLTQPRDWNDSWKDNHATIGEGGAEFLRAVTATRLGWLDGAGLQEALDKAVNSCLLAAEGQSWKAMRNREWGMNPYHCGLSFYALGLAARPGPALLRLRDYQSSARRGKATDFARALECGSVKACTPRWLPRLAGEEALEAVLRDYANQPDSLLRASSAWPAAMVKPIAFRHVGLLMRTDCGGAISMYQEPAAARIAEGPTCRTLRPGMVVVGAEGLPLFDGDSAAAKASIAACEAGGKTVLGLQDGSSVTLACDASVKLPAQFYSVDIGKAQALTR